MATVAEILATRWKKAGEKAAAIHLSEVCDVWGKRDFGQADNLAPSSVPVCVHQALPCCVVTLPSARERPRENVMASRFEAISDVVIYVPAGTGNLSVEDEIRVTSPTGAGSQEPRCFDVTGIEEDDSRRALLPVYAVRRR
jgi:hypothetical protein